LPGKTHDTPHWEAATKVLMLVAESGGPVMMAHIGMMRAISHGKAVTTAPRKKRVKAHQLLK